jgi:hypothetical protein
MSLFHFRHALNAANAALDRIPKPFRQQVDPAKRRAARDIFDAAFPQMADLRIAIAHAGEFSRPKDVEKHLVAGDMVGIDGISATPNTMVFVSACLHGRQLISSYFGKNVRYEISGASAEALRNARGAFYDALAVIRRL